MDDVVREFLVESRENLDQLDVDLVALEQDPTHRDTLASVFRTVHTIKGTCGFFGYTRLEHLAHVGETLLGLLRDGALLLDAARTTALLQLGDALRSILEEIESTGDEGDRDWTQLIKTLEQLQEDGDAEADDGRNSSSDGSSSLEIFHPPEEVESSSAVATPAPSGAVPAAEAGEMPQAEGSQAGAAHAASPQATTPQATTPQAAASSPPGPSPTDASPTGERKSKADGAAGSRSGSTESKPSIVDASIRVDVALLDSLMNQVGELVLARNQIIQHTASHDDSNLVTTAQRLNLITTELQESIMKTRMQPIGGIWGKFPRVVRDLSSQLDKQVTIEMEGEETELDRTIIEAIKDPLTHIVRNAVDHGIEMPDVRVAAGKPALGTLRLHAFHEGGQVNIGITDDGAGIDVARVKNKALERGLISADLAARMGDREAMQLIFSPGFSTASQVTNISGRGVGMDVVKTNIEKIGGSIDIQSELGQGTNLRIKIPLTLAIIPALIVECRGDSYAIPQVSLVELVRLDLEHATQVIEWIHDVPVYRLRGNLLPLIWLEEQLGLGRPDPLTKAHREEEADPSVLHIAVLQADDCQFGLVVDQICDNQEIVVKPLGSLLQDITCYAGATIMGDGRVALILDALGIAVRSRVLSELREAQSQAAMLEAERSGIADHERLLLFLAGDSTPKAVPLSGVARLEEFPRDQIEYSSGKPVVQYRGDIMPLIELGEVLGKPSCRREGDALQVIALTNRQISVGIVVDEILDVAEDPLEKLTPINRKPLRGSAVVGGRVTEIVDLEQVLASAGLNGPLLELVENS